MDQQSEQNREQFCKDQSTWERKRAHEEEVCCTLEDHLAQGDGELAEQRRWLHDCKEQERHELEQMRGELTSWDLECNLQKCLAEAALRSRETVLLSREDACHGLEAQNDPEVL